MGFSISDTIKYYENKASDYGKKLMEKCSLSGSSDKFKKAVLGNTEKHKLPGSVGQTEADNVCRQPIFNPHGTSASSATNLRFDGANTIFDCEDTGAMFER